ncbi:hypothetical protein [Plesiomonas shigelloides]|uniref:hypothetical protein n=1 Tax=Plesiomonas shigelloides TaxID=703 RepID=UPI0021198563|nr:hypothetical protein [Plesiomonas shigelloides]MCQ8860078.1 hypothetical protein [Plesiomonas shigelloides]
MIEIYAYIVAFIAYFILEYNIRKRCYPVEPKPNLSFLPKWTKGKEWTIFVSSGYWLARYYKNRLSYLPKERKKHLLRQFIKRNNTCNLIVSFIITILSFHLIKEESLGLFLINFISAFVLFRFISRAFEITYAFSNDVMSHNKNRSGLCKERRIQLAIKSYIELYIVSAPVYYAFDLTCTKPEALTLSLSVGSLTNVGAAFPTGYSYASNLVFIQIFSTLSLIVLSLAIYISRKE